MILSESINLKINNGNLPYYKSLGYEQIKIGDIISINIDKLSKGSNFIINVKCDYCECVKNISYKLYNKQLSL